MKLHTSFIALGNRRVSVEKIAEKADEPVWKDGADSRICTGDLAITNRSLY